KVSRSTVVNILKDAGLPTGPERGEATWDQFIKSHAKTLWACDFLRHRIVTKWGFRDAYMLVFVNVATRRAVATASTEHPDAAWVAAQVPLFKAAAGDGATECRVLTRDSDTKFGRPFDEALRACDITPVRLPHRAPNLNAHVERFIQTVQDECLDRFIVLGTRHLDQVSNPARWRAEALLPIGGVGAPSPRGSNHHDRFDRFASNAAAVSSKTATMSARSSPNP
ncbi:MAG: transposase, partial [Leptolyngbya sp. PLA1]|nr:transposase [Leptolyngbya sp. PLA1]